jgi:hypothetical protein
MTRCAINRRLALSGFFSMIAPIVLGAQQNVPDSALLTVNRVFTSGEFDGDDKHLGGH